MSRPAKFPDNRFIQCSSDFNLMHEKAPHVLERWATTLCLPVQDEYLRDEILTALAPSRRQVAA